MIKQKGKPSQINIELVLLIANYIGIMILLVIMAELSYQPSKPRPVSFIAFSLCLFFTVCGLTALLGGNSRLAPVIDKINQDDALLTQIVDYTYLTDVFYGSTYEKVYMLDAQAIGSAMTRADVKKIHQINIGGTCYEVNYDLNTSPVTKILLIKK